LLIAAVPARAEDQKRVDRKVRWEVTFALRVPAAETPVEVRLALPTDSDDQVVTDVAVKARGLDSEVVREGEESFVRIKSDGSEARRIAVTYEVTRNRRKLEVPAVRPLEYPPVEMLKAPGPTSSGPFSPRRART